MVLLMQGDTVLFSSQQMAHDCMRFPGDGLNCRGIIVSVIALCIAICFELSWKILFRASFNVHYALPVKNNCLPFEYRCIQGGLGNVLNK